MEKEMTKTSDPENVSDANVVKLALAWSFVGIPLALGIYNSLANAVLLFQ